MHTQTSHYQQGSPGQPARTSKASRLEQTGASNKTSPKRVNITSNLQRTYRSRTESNKSPIAEAIKENIRLHIAAPSRISAIANQLQL
jgi:hypothetical protein